MKKISIAGSLLALAVGSFFAGNAAKKFIGFTNLYYKHGVNKCTQFTSQAVWTNGGTGSAIIFKTAAGASVQIFTTSLCNTTAVSVKLLP